jgi:hypothetical protein
MLVKLDTRTPAGWEDDSDMVHLDTCEQCGAVVMVSDPKAVEKHRAWHVMMETIRRRVT